MAYTSEKETHEIEFEGLNLTIEGYVDGEPESRDPASRMHYFFYVTKATTKSEFGGDEFVSEFGPDFLKKLNSEYEYKIFEQIQEG